MSVLRRPDAPSVNPTTAPKPASPSGARRETPAALVDTDPSPGTCAVMSRQEISAMSASCSPTAGANLKPWPLHAEPIT